MRLPAVSLHSLRAILRHRMPGGLNNLSEGHLLQIPILLVLGIFYGITNAVVRKLNRDKIRLIKHVNTHHQDQKAWPASEERVRLVLENALEAFIMMDTSGCILEWNRQAEALFGWTRDEVVGQRLSETIIPPQFQEAHEFGLQQCVATGEGPMLNKRIKIEALHRKGHLFPVELRVSPIHLDDSTVFTAFISDITERKQLETQLRQSQKMDAIGQLAGGVAHDFNNMLLIIGGYSDLLANDPSFSEDQRQSIQQIGQANKRAAALTGQLLAFSRRQVLQPKVVNLNSLIGSLEQMLQTLVGESIEFVTDLASCLGCVKADPGQIEQVVINLCINARDAMPQGGRLTVVTDSMFLDQAAIRQYQFDANPGSQVRLVVKDTGIGMDIKTLSHIFEPFFTTKPNGKGTGLGLASVYGIIKQSGGAIHVTSEPGKGTSVIIYLPRVEEPASINGTELHPAATPKGAETVLVVEDEPAVGDFICRSLRTYGYTVLEARHGIEAVIVAQRQAGPIHLLLTDIVMPQMNGREVAEHLMPQHPDMKVLFMSGYTEDAILRKGVVTEAVDFLQKPFTPTALAYKIRQVLGTRQESLVR